MTPTQDVAADSYTDDMIPPKPTNYRGITFRSRLEARWAVCLDWYKLLNSWGYEPSQLSYTYRDGTRYVPDFIVNLPLFHGLLEIKPCEPTAEYRAMLDLAQLHFELPIILCTGGFYGQVPYVHSLVSGAKSPITNCRFFPRISEAVQTAAYYRFDLANQPLPPFRVPVSGEFDFRQSQWAAQERKRNHNGN